MQFKPSLFIYLSAILYCAQLYIYVVKANDTFCYVKYLCIVSHSCILYNLLYSLCPLCNSCMCATHNFAPLTLLYFCFFFMIFAPFGGGVCAPVYCIHVVISGCTKWAGINFLICCKKSCFVCFPSHKYSIQT